MYVHACTCTVHVGVTELQMFLHDIVCGFDPHLTSEVILCRLVLFDGSVAVHCP